MITRITLKLIPLPRAVRGLCAVFPDLVRAMRAVSAVMTSGVTPSAVEFLDSRCLDLVGDMLPLPDRPATAALLLAEADGSATQADEDLGCIARVCQACDALDVRPAGDDGERKRLWEVRRQVSLRIHDRWPVYVPEDVALPLGGIAAFVDRLPDLETRFGVRIYAFGHAGDGNIHINITAGQDHDPVAVEACTRELLADVVARGGTISGEHGIGTAKSRYLDLELSPVSIGLQKSLKALFDPGRVLNPGKVFP